MTVSGSLISQDMSVVLAMVLDDALKMRWDFLTGCGYVLSMPV